MVFFKSVERGAVCVWSAFKSKNFQLLKHKKRQSKLEVIAIINNFDWKYSCLDRKMFYASALVSKRSSNF